MTATKPAVCRPFAVPALANINDRRDGLATVNPHARSTAGARVIRPMRPRVPPRNRACMQATLMAGRRDNRNFRPVRADVTSAQVGDRYRLLSVLGAGNAGTVWLAHDFLLDRSVALKRIDRANPAARAVEEAQAAAAVPHANTVKVHDLVSDGAGGVDWVVMEVLSGQNAAEVLREEVCLSVDETCYIARAVLAALEAMHAAGLVHRDVKPANVQLCLDGRVVLLDFGLATSPATVDPTAVVGTLPYMAPEIFGQGSYSPASDLYALGMTLYAALGGAPPEMPDFDVDTGLPLAPELVHVPAAAGSLGTVVRGLLRSDPCQRFTAREARRHLDTM